jgi:hypothetical protein
MHLDIDESEVQLGRSWQHGIHSHYFDRFEMFIAFGCPSENMRVACICLVNF